MKGYGAGRIYRQKRKMADGSLVESGPYWLAYYRRGELHRESSKTEDKKKARRFLKKRIDETKQPVFSGPAENRLRIEDAQKKIIAHYSKPGKESSLKTATHCFKPLKKFFKFDPLVDITSERIEEYHAHRLNSISQRGRPVKLATANRELSYLRIALNLLKLSKIPRFELPPEDNARQGFCDPGDFYNFLKILPGDDERDLAEFTYNSGWRGAEPKNLQWAQIDEHRTMATLEKKQVKERKVRYCPLVGVLKEIIERRHLKRKLDCPYVFHRAGKQIKYIDRRWKAAAIKAGLGQMIPDTLNIDPTKKVYEGLTVHDTRRSAVRNFRKSGLTESDGMMLSGHRTRSVYARYDIRDNDDAIEAQTKVQKWIESQKAKTKVINIKSKRAV